MSSKDIYYVYTDRDNNPLYRQVRKNGEKEFCLQRYEDGKWVNGMKDIDRVLYNLPNVITAVKEGITVYWVEGEKDADKLNKKGLVATTIAGRR